MLKRSGLLYLDHDMNLQLFKKKLCIVPEILTYDSIFVKHLKAKLPEIFPVRIKHFCNINKKQLL